MRHTKGKNDGYMRDAPSFSRSLEFYRILLLFTLHGRLHHTPEQYVGRNKQKVQLEEYLQISRKGKTLSVCLSFSHKGTDIIRFTRECCEGLL